jgi:hypothetical protein
MPHHSSHQSIVKNEKSAAMTVKSRNSAPVSGGQGVASGEGRHHMISTAAYYRAKQRGFVGGDQVADWLAAEAVIDAILYWTSPAIIDIP